MGLIHTFVEVTGEKLVGRPFWLPTSLKRFGAHVRDFKSYLKFLRNLENKICTPAETRYFYFSNCLKNDKECWKSRHALLSSTKSYLTTKNEIHSMMSPWLKTRQKFHLCWQKTWFLYKDKCFRQKMWIRVISFFAMIWDRI